MTSVSNTLTLRAAVPADVPVILSLIRELAEYEKLTHEVSASEEALRRDLFGERPVAEVLIADWNDAPAGFALFFANYSTFLARPGIYLEDLYVRRALRGHGIGRALLSRVATMALARGCGRLEWSVLDWNTPALKFYATLGARAMSEWTIHRVTGSDLQELAAATEGQHTTAATRE